MSLAQSQKHTLISRFGVGCRTPEQAWESFAKLKRPRKMYPKIETALDEYRELCSRSTDASTPIAVINEWALNELTDILNHDHEKTGIANLKVGLFMEAIHDRTITLEGKQGGNQIQIASRTTSSSLSRHFAGLIREWLSKLLTRIRTRYSWVTLRLRLPRKQGRPKLSR